MGRSEDARTSLPRPHTARTPRPGPRPATARGLLIARLLPLIVLLGLTASVVEAAAQTVTLQVDQDSWLKEAAPSDNFGDEKELPIKKKPGDNERAVLRFDLSPIPSNAEISSATATFRVTTPDTSPVNVFRIKADWAENTVTWGSTGTAFDPTTIHGSFTPAQDDSFVSVDLTGLVQDWVCGEANHGLMLIPTSDDEQSKYHSKDEDIASFRPVLTVEVGSQVGPCPGALPTITSLLPETLTTTQGGTGILTVTLTPVQSTDTDVTLTSSDPGVAGVPSTVTVPAGLTSAPIGVAANTPGTAQITASLNGTSATSTFTVTAAAPTVVALQPPTNPVTQGGTVTLTVTMSAAQPIDTPVAISASPAGIVSVPAQVTVLAGQVTALVPVDAVGLGTAMVQASLNGTSAEAAVQVTPPPPEVTGLTPSPLTLVVGAAGTLTVSVNVAQATNTVVTVNVDAPTIVQVPATVTVAPGQLTADVTVNGLAVGTATVTATLDASSAQATVNVVPPPPQVVGVDPDPLPIEQGATGTLSVTINAAQLTDTTLAVTNSAPTIVQGPASIIVPAGQTSAGFSVTGLAVGSAVITASINSTSASATVQVTPPPSLITGLTPVTQSVPAGTPGLLRVTVAPAPVAPAVVTLSSDTPTVASVPAMVTIPAGAFVADFPVLSHAEGTAIITATLNGSSATASITVTPPILVALTITPQDPTNFVGATIAFTATGTLTDGTTQDLTTSVAWTSSDETVATIASDGVATALAVGPTTIAATITVPEGTFSDSTTLTLQPTPTLTLDPATATLQVGESVAFTVTSSAPADVGGLTVTLTQSGTGSVTIQPAPVVIPEGAGSAPFNVTAEAPGTVTLTASAPVRIDATATLTLELGPPAITDVSPATGTVGTPVTITGLNFAPVAADNQIRFTGASGPVTAILTSAMSTTLTTTVPQNARTGVITVTTPGGVATSDVFTVTLSQDFTIAAFPSLGTAIAGDQTSYQVTAGGVGNFTSLITLTVPSLPAGITATFIPPQIAANGASVLSMSVDSSVAASTVAFTVNGQATIDGQTVTSTVPLQLTVVGAGTTGFVGRVLNTDDEPLENVIITLLDANDQATTTTTNTDAGGNFVLTSVPVGNQMFFVDGRQAQASPSDTRSYPPVETVLDIVANQANRVPHNIYLPAIDTSTTTPTPPNNPSPIIVTSPDLPDLEIEIPPGTTITLTEPDGTTSTVTEVSITGVPVDRAPMSLTAGLDPTLLFTIQPGGAVPQNAEGGVIIRFPNWDRYDPGQQVDLIFFDLTQRDWVVYGQGTVSSDGRQVIPDPGVVLPRFAWHGPSAAPADEKSGEETDGEPVDLITGFFTLNATDVVLPSPLPFALTRSYRTGFNNIGNFGFGTSTPFEIILDPRGPDQFVLVMPDQKQFRFRKQPDGSFLNFTDPSMQGAVITETATETVLTFKDQSQWKFTAGGGRAFLLEQRDRNGNTITISRNGAQITAITDSVGRQITVDQTNSVSITQLSDPIGRTWRYAYDNGIRLTTVTDPLGGVTRYTYDAQGRMRSITDKRGITFLTNEYDAQGRVCRQTQADGGVWLFYYVPSDAAVSGPAQQLLSEAQAGGPISLAPCTVLGAAQTVLATIVVDPRGNPTTSRFNSNGYLIARTDGLGQTTKFERENGTNFLVSTTDPLGHKTTFTYDAAGNVSRTIDADGNKTEIDYHPTFNRLTEIREFLDQTTFLRTTFTYDPSTGDLLTTTNPNNETTTFTYNTFGQPTAVQGPIATDPPTTSAYDADGNLIATTDPLGNTSQRAYDAVSRLISITDRRGHQTQFGYDVLNRLTAIADERHGITRFDYDPNGNLLAVTDAKDQTTTLTYDVMGRLETRTDALNRQEVSQYDTAGNLTQFTDRKSQASTFTYDELNRQIGASYADGSTISFSYDSTGRLAVAEDSTSGRIEFTYDDLDRLTKELTPQGAQEYAYDALGRRTTMTANGATPVAYGYDAASRLTQVAQAGLVVGLAYDAEGRRTGLTYPNGTNTSYSYDNASRLTAITHNGPSGVIESLSYAYDAPGSRISLTRTNGTATLLPAAVQAAYDAANEQIQFNSLTPNLTYDANGNLASQSDVTGVTLYTWDARNRLIGLAGPAVSASFSYDVLDRRVSKTINGVTTSYLYDGDDIVQEIGENAVGASYIRSLSIDEPFVRQTSTGNEFYHVDGLGSPLTLTNQAGSVQASYQYETFGKTTVTGTSSNPFQYTARENDGTGLYYYRARYYSPQLQRFLREDPAFSKMLDENPYVYVFNSPINFVDPSGRVVQYYAPGCIITYNKPPAKPKYPYPDKRGLGTSRAAPLTEQIHCKLQECIGINPLIVTGGAEPGHDARAHKEGRGVDYGKNSNPRLRDPSTAAKFLCCARKSGYGWGIEEGGVGPHFHLEVPTVTQGTHPDQSMNILPENTCRC